ncbi:hypothetical protein [Rickettsia endosymbiont of Cardiosporidium cionae]|uniref:hypothetical protein n=1 Tax=Rickettsia endosymbiont of Cardiosporidium cionae TaxID=2777155 RepID=UPI0018946435|nr:hypothetical protein [Rickettsia endosymbiont of Cardiosporidium cionae]
MPSSVPSSVPSSMPSIFVLIRHDLKLQYRVYNTPIYLGIFLLFNSVASVLIITPDRLEELITALFILFIPMLFLNLQNMLKTEFLDGCLELLMVHFTPIEIVISKYIVLSLYNIVAFFIYMLFFYLVFSFTLYKVLILYVISVLLIFVTISLFLLSSSIECYFSGRKNYVSLVIIPILIPNMILSGILIDSDKLSYLLLIISSSMITIPIALVGSSYLIKNIYNI